MSKAASLGLLTLLTRDHIRSGVTVRDWKEAVAVTGDLMHRLGLTNREYTQAMQNLIEQAGPYMVIAPGIALLHARPEDGARQAGLVMLTLNTPVNFGHSTNDPVWLVFGLAATTDKTHVQALAELAMMLSEPGCMEALQKSQNEEDLLNVVQDYVARTQPQAGGERG